MKIRESGMPEESLWSTFFDVGTILNHLKVNEEINHLVDFGCGYGHFSVAAAKRIGGRVSAIDIEKHMLECTRAKALDEQIDNIDYVERDFLATGSGLSSDSQDYAMIFNLLHLENPTDLLQEAKKVLTVGGLVGVIHWIQDPATPRGPPMDIRPTPKQCLEWIKAVGFEPISHSPIDLPPYHFGLVAKKT